jgi:hypothetical protein
MRAAALDTIVVDSRAAAAYRQAVGRHSEDREWNAAPLTLEQIIAL